MERQTEPTGDRVVSESRTMDIYDAEDDPAFWVSSPAVDTGIEDLAIEHDHYLYGTPKRDRKADSLLKEQE